MRVVTTGGSKRQRTLARIVTKFCAQELMGAKLCKNIYIRTKFKRKLTALGYVTWLDDNLRPREFELELDAGLDDEEMIITICHELVHVKQMARGELREVYKGKYSRQWRGRDYTECPYDDQPWEKEAYRLQGKLAEMFSEHCEQNGVTL